MNKELINALIKERDNLHREALKARRAYDKIALLEAKQNNKLRQELHDEFTKEVIGKWLLIKVNKSIFKLVRPLKIVDTYPSSTFCPSVKSGEQIVFVDSSTNISITYGIARNECNSLRIDLDDIMNPPFVECEQMLRMIDGKLCQINKMFGRDTMIYDVRSTKCIRRIASIGRDWIKSTELQMKPMNGGLSYFMIKLYKQGSRHAMSIPTNATIITAKDSHTLTQDAVKELRSIVTNSVI